MVINIATDPALRLSEDRFMRFIASFDPYGEGVVDTQDRKWQTLRFWFWANAIPHTQPLLIMQV